jgi:hypothetical protein
MTYEKLKKLHNEYESFFAEEECDWLIGKGGAEAVGLIDDRKIAAHDYKRHCVNNFDKALEALKTSLEQETCVCDEAELQDGTCHACFLERTIKELETVED